MLRDIKERTLFISQRTLHMSDKNEDKSCMWKHIKITQEQVVIIQLFKNKGA